MTVFDMMTIARTESNPVSSWCGLAESRCLFIDPVSQTMPCMELVPFLLEQSRLAAPSPRPSQKRLDLSSEILHGLALEGDALGLPQLSGQYGYDSFDLVKELPGRKRS